MDYMGILKKAWNVTWRYKILWLFGFFAGSGFGGGNGGSGSSYRTGGSQPFNNVSPADIERFLAQYMGVIILSVVALTVIGLILLVVGVAARGGLIHLVNEAEEGREVRAADGWRVGFSMWWRVFGIGLLAALPGLLLAVVVAMVFGSAIAAAIASSAAGQDIGAAIGSTLVGGLCVVGILGIIVAVLSVMLGISAELGYRYAVLQNRGAIDSIKMGWRDLWSRRGAFVMFLVQIAVSIVVGIALGIVGAIIAVPGVVAASSGAAAVGGLLLFITGLVFIVPLAMYGAFHHAMWTIFFRRMTGMETMPVMAAPISAAGYIPPAPPVAPAPPAPPVMMAPEPPAPIAPPAPPVMPDTYGMPESPMMPPATVEPPAGPESSDPSGPPNV